MKPTNMAKLLLGVSNSGGKVATTSIELIAAIPIEPNAIFNQELQNLEKQGILAIAFKKIKILDPAMLHKMAHSSE